MANVFIPRESRPGETRVAATPDTVRKMIKLGLEVVMERGAGEGSAYPDADYEAAGARLTDDPGTAAGAADVILTVRPPDAGRRGRPQARRRAHRPARAAPEPGPRALHGRSARSPPSPWS